MKMRQVNISDKEEWARIRNALWLSSLKEHLGEIEEYFANPEIDIVEVLSWQETMADLADSSN